MRSGDGFLCVYSITIEASFLKVREFYDHVLRVKDVDQIPFVIVGNKCDLEKQRKVPTSRAEALAQEIGAPLLETSAKTGQNVSECFFTIVRAIKVWREKYDTAQQSGSGRSKKDKCFLL
jgi:small GTP-binding protein